MGAITAHLVVQVIVSTAEGAWAQLHCWPTAIESYESKDES